MVSSQNWLQSHKSFPEILRWVTEFKKFEHKNVSYHNDVFIKNKFIRTGVVLTI